MNVEEKIKNYSGPARLILALKEQVLKGSKLSAGQLILAKQILIKEAIDNDDKSLIKQELKQFKIDWDKYSHRLPFSFQKEGVNFLLNKSHAILADEMGTGKCAAPETTVLVNGEYLTLENLWGKYADLSTIEHDNENGVWCNTLLPLKINSYNESLKRVELKQVNKLYRQFINEPIKEYKFRSGRKIRVTLKHKFCDDTLTWTNNPTKRVSCPFRLKDTSQNILLPNGIPYFLGYLISEGNEAKSGGAITQWNSDVLDKLENILKDNGYTSYRIEDTSINIHVKLINYLKSIGYSWGNSSETKTIPNVIFQLSKEQKKEFLSALFSGDGSVEKNNVSYCSKSQTLILQLQSLLLEFGINSFIKPTWNCASNGTRVKRKYYNMIIPPEHSLQLTKTLFFDQPNKNFRLSELNEKARNTNIYSINCIDTLKKLKKLHKGLSCTYFGYSSSYIRKTNPIAPSFNKVKEIVSLYRTLLLNQNILKHFPVNKSGSKVKLEKILSQINYIELEKLILSLEKFDNDLWYDKIVSCEKVNYQGYVYDLEVLDNHNYIANNILIHNTVQTTLAVMEKGFKRILIICPNILKLNWQREIGFYDDIENTHVCYSKDFDTSKKWTIINYDIVSKYKEQLKKGKFDLLICDEAQNCKSLATKRTKAVKTISTKCKNVWLLTGTPIANRPIDFYALLKLCKHPVGSDKAYYTKQYCGGELNPFGFGYKSDGASNLKELHYKTQDVILRRLKKDCLDLPDKILTPIVLKLNNQSQYDNAPQERITELYLESLDPDSEKFGRDVDQGLAFVEVAVWRKYCALEKLKDGSIEEGINEVLEKGEKVVIFTNYLEVIDTLSQRLGEFCLTLDGRVSLEERQRRIDLFQNDPRYDKMVVNIKVGNAGLTLTAANNVFYNDLPWSPAELSQSIDRLHRIGQKLQVNVNFFVYKNTIDEVMLDVLQSKITNINLAVEGKANTGLLSGDIRDEVYHKLRKK